MNRGERQHQERMAYARHKNTPRPMGYHSRYHGKTPGKLCSCEMCGNPRRHYGDRTRQELLAEFDSIDHLIDDVLHPKEIALIGCECAFCTRTSDAYDLPEAAPVTVSLGAKLKRAA